MRIVTISSKRQVTIPKDYLQLLGLQSYGKAILEKDEQKLVLKPIKESIVDETAGSLKKYVHPSMLGKSIKQIDKEAKKLYTKYLARKYELKE